MGTFWRSKNSLGCPRVGVAGVWRGSGSPTALPKLGGRREQGWGERECGGQRGGRMWGHDPQIVKAGWETASLNQQLEVLRSHLKSFKIWNRYLTHILKVFFFFLIVKHSFKRV